MTVRIPITHLRPPKSRFQHVRFNSSASWGTASQGEGRPLIRYLTKRDQVIDQFNYHFKIPGNEPNTESAASKLAPSNVTTIGESPRFTLISVPAKKGPRIDYTTGGGGGDKFGIRMRSVRVETQPPRPSGALTGLEIPGIKALTLPVFEGPSNPILLNEFLRKYPPSTTTHQSIDGTWIFVKRDNSNPGYPVSKPDNYTCTARAKDLLEETTQRIQSYDADEATNASRAAGQEWRPRQYLLERVFKSAGRELRDLAVKYNYTCGGWFIPASPSRVDQVFAELSRSLIAGDLSRTFAHAVKASVLDVPNLPPNFHIVNVMVPDAWDKEANKRVLDVLLNIYGLAPEGCKPELFVQLGYGHMHKTKGDSCTFTPQDFYTKYELTKARFTVAREKSFTRGKILGNRLAMGMLDKPEDKARTPEATN
ncbi:uncharacterized protein DFL_008883 [Arthrobotrys flagrans]|uniref:Uncharacterized protein n=1 Tax=Arthrobotrys flagrans TaxID=97331 RepID=A0A436ZQ25_ARTFL|nr:hypothetical protein DFL_008883 [Arthrobotrys flagrans]